MLARLPSNQSLRALELLSGKGDQVKASASSTFCGETNVSFDTDSQASTVPEQDSSSASSTSSSELTPSPVQTLCEEEEEFDHSSPLVKQHQELTQKRKTASSPISILSLPEEMKISILSFLDVKSLQTVLKVSHTARELLTDADDSPATNVVWKAACQRAWPSLPSNTQLEFRDTFRVPIANSTKINNTNFGVLLSLAEAKTPTEIDPHFFRPTRYSRRYHIHYPRREIADVELEFYQNDPNVVRFTGTVGLGDRCIRSKQPLTRPKALTYEQKEIVAAAMPKGKRKQKRSLWKRIFRNRLSSRSNAISLLPWKRRFSEPIPSWRPFVTPFVSRNRFTKKVAFELAPRLISYFEISILPSPPKEEKLQRPSFNWREETNPVGTQSMSECIAVGVAVNEFSHYGRMPGWDSKSFGFHGDDGGVFHNSGAAVIQNYGPSYGVGDTVGCGVDYLNQCIFFTLNGKFIGPAFEHLPQSLLEQDLYPVVGIDSPCPVKCNFGNESPFLFDLTEMMLKQKEVSLKAVELPQKRK